MLDKKLIEELIETANMKPGQIMVIGCSSSAMVGQRIGKAIYEHIVAYAKRRKCHNVTLNVWSCNESAMIFYESLGLKPQKVGMEAILEEAECWKKTSNTKPLSRITPRRDRVFPT